MYLNEIVHKLSLAGNGRWLAAKVVQGSEYPPLTAEC